LMPEMTSVQVYIMVGRSAQLKTPIKEMADLDSAL
jgi:hypothetical protein